MAAFPANRLCALGKQSGGIFQNSVRFFKHREPAYRGIYKIDGMRVYKDELLVRQGRQINYYPGLNVTCQRKHFDQLLIALCEGTVFVTTEEVNPGHEYFAISGKKRLADANIPFKKLTFNVVPDKEIGRFRLIESI